ncbi:YlzJ-like family protein [Bacillus sp. EB600]|uniref:YlzJ-like family protein n=1 Tax=Bacillus sp. EB600 TaxID=2806345 RepID=UPI00210B141A|nr:YlzJ-like family protein [Bacillus sp. EB600]MCQ6280142.1 YlzJ-like family protein [Bacillus sp. EB600]
MILYTTVPYELIFPDDMESFDRQKTINYNGVPLLVDCADPQSMQIVRVLSSDPQHFLDDRFSPGTKISLFNLEGMSST